jgi:hypothetical protein
MRPARGLEADPDPCLFYAAKLTALHYILIQNERVKADRFRRDGDVETADKIFEDLLRTCKSRETVNVNGNKD